MHTVSLALLPALALALALGAAVWHDVRARRIPNTVVMAGCVIALLLHSLLPAAAALPGTPASGLGPLFSLAGLATGLLLLLPFYALQALGAGDVKLMAMVGAFLGSPAVIGATLLAMLAGGLMALVVALWCGQLAHVLGNVHHMLRSALVRGMGGVDARIDAPATPTGKLPYAIAIACGTGLQLALSGWPAWRMFS
ncbi:prepilin peptidase [Massilia sp. CF038]|uniref:A24 family peptidase n=1 Tax=Massilia sp. CF038 TaxID=1881045 RepID=UPI00091D9A21|nr:prepilin peptidase [Massilia sp. CF038]SHG50580.1 prepilin peptidase CpaA [Massilia sp. CF038]